MTPILLLSEQACIPNFLLLILIKYITSIFIPLHMRSPSELTMYHSAFYSNITLLMLAFQI